MLSTSKYLTLKVKAQPRTDLEVLRGPQGDMSHCCKLTIGHCVAAPSGKRSTPWGGQDSSSRDRFAKPCQEKAPEHEHESAHLSQDIERVRLRRPILLPASEQPAASQLASQATSQPASKVAHQLASQPGSQPGSAFLGKMCKRDRQHSQDERHAEWERSRQQNAGQ